VVLGVASNTDHARAVQPLCALIPNGSFADGEAGWSLLTEFDPVGDAGAFVDAAIIDGTQYQGFGGNPGFDSSVLALTVSAGAGFSCGTGEVAASASAATTATVTDRYLRIERGGTFEFQFLGQGLRGLQAIVRVDGPDGVELEHAIYASSTEPEPGCDFGLAVLGTFDADPNTVYIDLFSQGFLLGDEVAVSVELRAQAGALTRCQFTQVDALLIIDNFTFCDVAPNPADFDDDCDADLADYALFADCLTGPGGFYAFGCHGPAMGDFDVDLADVAVLLERFTGPLP